MVSEGGAVGPVAVLGVVVTIHVPENTICVGDYTAVVKITHGGMHNSSVYIPFVHGAIIIPADLGNSDNPEKVT